MKKILIIDDSEVNLLLIQAIFENDRDIEIISEHDSTKALSLIQKKVPDIIVLDLMMPHIDGFEILKKLRDDSSTKQIPVVVVSARHDRKSVETVMALGAKAYIKKPIDMEDVESKIRAILSGTFVA